MKELVYRRLFLRAVEQFGAEVGYIEGDQTTTFAVHASRVFRLGDALRRELGCKPDTRIAVLAPNSRAFVEIVHAGLLGGGMVNPLNVRLGAAELRHVLADSGS